MRLQLKFAKKEIVKRVNAKQTSVESENVSMFCRRSAQSNDDDDGWKIR